MNRRIPYCPLQAPSRPIRYPQQPHSTRFTSLWQRLVIVGPAKPLDSRACTEPLLALHSLPMPLALDVTAAVDEISIGIVCPTTRTREVARQVLGAAPDWQLTSEDVPSPAPATNQLTGRLSRHSDADWQPLHEISAFGAIDPLNGLLAAAPLSAGEHLLVRYLVRPASADRLARAAKWLTTPLPGAGALDLMLDTVFGAPRGSRFEPPLQRRLEARLQSVSFEVHASIFLSGTDITRLASYSRGLTAYFSHRFDAGFGSPALSWKHGHSAEMSLGGGDWSTALLLNVSELASLWHVPSAAVLLPGVQHLSGPRVVLPPALRNTTGILLGVHYDRGQDLPVRLPIADLEGGHMVVLGRTGTGKSTLLHNLLRQLATMGSGMVILDSHGSLVTTFATQSVPQRRLEDVVYLDLGDTQYPVSLGLFARPEGVDHDAFVESTTGLMRLLFADSGNFPRLEEVLSGTVSVLCELSGATLLDATRLLGDPVFRARAMHLVRDPMAREFLSEFHRHSDAAQRENGTARSQSTAPALSLADNSQPPVSNH